MLEIIILVISFMLIAMVLFIVIRAIITRQDIEGTPPVPPFYFYSAKLLLLINLSFLLFRGFRISPAGNYTGIPVIDYIALILLFSGGIIVLITAFQLNKDLIFGLPKSGIHKLQTSGIYTLSRHPFYLGFIFILISSCLFYPHILNIIAFVAVLLIHHFIMNGEERFLVSQFGDEYKNYMKKVKRYIFI